MEYIYGDDSTIRTEISTIASVEEYDHQVLDVPETSPAQATEHEMQLVQHREDSISVPNENSSRVGTPLFKPCAPISSMTLSRPQPVASHLLQHKADLMLYSGLFLVRCRRNTSYHRSLQTHQYPQIRLPLLELDLHLPYFTSHPPPLHQIRCCPCHSVVHLPALSSLSYTSTTEIKLNGTLRCAFISL
ncbi:Uncharacterized protein Rs2_29495 [Raphanus sativus]|nr:Uncharacterized protein Rs2_29495 [Raphanus sativus]